MKTGKIIQIIGPVVDVEFSEEVNLQDIYNALIVKHNLSANSEQGEIIL